jgi:hypothetical protein
MQASNELLRKGLQLFRLRFSCSIQLLVGRGWKKRQRSLLQTGIGDTRFALSASNYYEPWQSCENFLSGFRRNCKTLGETYCNGRGFYRSSLSGALHISRDETLNGFVEARFVGLLMFDHELPSNL